MAKSKQCEIRSVPMPPHKGHACPLNPLFFIGSGLIMPALLALTAMLTVVASALGALALLAGCTGVPEGLLPGESKVFQGR